MVGGEGREGTGEDDGGDAVSRVARNYVTGSGITSRRERVKRSAYSRHTNITFLANCGVQPPFHCQGRAAPYWCCWLPAIRAESKHSYCHVRCLCWRAGPLPVDSVEKAVIYVSESRNDVAENDNSKFFEPSCLFFSKDVSAFELVCQGTAAFVFGRLYVLFTCRHIWDAEKFMSIPIPSARSASVIYRYRRLPLVRWPSFTHRSVHISVVVVCWLLNFPAKCSCISGMDPRRQFYMLPH